MLPGINRALAGALPLRDGVAGPAGLRARQGEARGILPLRDRDAGDVVRHQGWPEGTCTCETELNADTPSRSRWQAYLLGIDLGTR
jgi:hypothetical protein